MPSNETESASTELAPWDEPPRGLAAIEPTPELVEQAYNAIINKELPPEIGDPEITARLIMERIKAGTFDESMDPRESLASWSKEYAEQPVTVIGFHLNPSTFENEEGEKGVYAVVELMVEGGELVTVSCGGGNVLMQLVKAWEENRYPFVCQLTGKATSTPGRKTYWLRTPGA
jgi:hypothetical protein